MQENAALECLIPAPLSVSDTVQELVVARFLGRRIYRTPSDDCPGPAIFGPSVLVQRFFMTLLDGNTSDFSHPHGLYKIAGPGHPSFIVGKRSADNARRLMMDLRSRITIPRPHEADVTGQYRKVLQISTDGFAAYPEAVDLAFGPYVKFGTIIKDYRNANMPYTPSEMVGTQRRGIIAIRDSEERTICTSHVERNNLTIRTFMKRFTRLALGFSKKLENLESAINLHMAYYNFCWRPGKMRITPAMAAKVTKTLWSFDDLMMGTAA